MLSADDKAAIIDVTNLYHHVIDSNEVERLNEVFTEDAVLDLSAFGAGVWHGLPAIIERFRKPQAITHASTTALVCEDGNGVVTLLSKTVAVRNDGTTLASIHNDRMQRTAEGWRSEYLLITAPVPVSRQA